VPRFTNHLVASGQMTVDDCFFVHAETVEKVYGVTVQLK
jgi:predicted urease superfamily metal-dependent hydrolase